MNCYAGCTADLYSVKAILPHSQARKHRWPPIFLFRNQSNLFIKNLLPPPILTVSESSEMSPRPSHRIFAEPDVRKLPEPALAGARTAPRFAALAASRMRGAAFLCHTRFIQTAGAGRRRSAGQPASSAQNAADRAARCRRSVARRAGFPRPARAQARRRWRQSAGWGFPP